jgi:hypothetical protein
MTLAEPLGGEQNRSVENIGDIWQHCGLNMHPQHDEHTDLLAATPAAPSGTEATGAGRPSTASPAAPREIGGREGPEPTRFGDWEKSGRCIDF